MPWIETCAMDEKLKFEAAYLDGNLTMSALCREFGISRPTGYALIEGYQENPEAAFVDRSRAPQSHPNETPGRLVKLILKQRHKQPAWGPATIRSVLAKTHPHEQWPAANTIGAIRERAGEIAPAPKRRRGVMPRTGH